MPNNNVFELLNRLLGNSKLTAQKNYNKYLTEAFINSLSETDKTFLNNLTEAQQDKFSEYAISSGQIFGLAFLKSLVLEEKLNNPNLVDETSSALILELKNELALTKEKLKLSEVAYSELSRDYDEYRKVVNEYKLQTASEMASMLCEINKLKTSNYDLTALPKNATQQEVAKAAGVKQPTISYRRNKALLQRDKAAKTLVLHRQRIINLFGSETKFLEFQTEFILIYRRAGFIKRINNHGTHRQAIHNIINEFSGEAQSLFMELTKDYKLSPCDGHIVFDFHKYLHSSHRVIEN